MINSNEVWKRNVVQVSKKTAFCGNIGLFCRKIGLLWDDTEQDEFAWGLDILNILNIALPGNVGLSCGHIGPFWGHIGLFGGNVGLFWGVTVISCRSARKWLFLGNVGLFGGNIGLFCWYAGLFCEKRALLRWHQTGWICIRSRHSQYSLLRMECREYIYIRNILLQYSQEYSQHSILRIVFSTRHSQYSENRMLRILLRRMLRILLRIFAIFYCWEWNVSVENSILNRE